MTDRSYFSKELLLIRFMKKSEKKMQKLGQVDSNKNDIMKYACVHLGGFNTE